MANATVALPPPRRPARRSPEQRLEHARDPAGERRGAVLHGGVTSAYPHAQVAPARLGERRDRRARTPMTIRTNATSSGTSAASGPTAPSAAPGMRSARGVTGRAQRATARPGIAATATHRRQARGSARPSSTPARALPPPRACAARPQADAHQPREPGERETARERQGDQSAEGRRTVAPASVDAGQEGAQEQPFAREEVEPGQRSDRRGAQDERRCRAPPPPEESAQRVEIAAVRPLRDGPEAEEEQALRQRVVPQVQQRGRPGESGDEGMMQRRSEETEPHRDRGHPGVLDRRVGQRALHVPLREREEHAADRAGRAEDQQHVSPP